MLNKYEILNGKIEQSEKPDASILVYINPDPEEKKYLVDELKVDEHTLNSSLDPDELSRIEFEPEHTAIIFKRPRNYSGKDLLYFKVASKGLFLFKDKLIVILSEDINIFEGKQFFRVTSLRDLMLKIIFRAIQHFLEHLKVFVMITDELEKKINYSLENKYLLNMFTLEKSLVYYLNAINSNALVYEKMRTYTSKIGFTTEELEFLDDLIIENTQCYKQCDIYSNILASLMDARASIVSNNINIMMKTLTIITILIMVPTFVVSAFSMNVKIPLSDHPYAFYIILSIAIVTILGIVTVWWKKKW